MTRNFNLTDREVEMVVEALRYHVGEFTFGDAESKAYEAEVEILLHKLGDLPRKIELHDLVLFTTNTGEFYNLHCLMARKGMGVDGWRDWIRDRVLPLYNRQIEPVTYDYETLANAAREIKDYYERHVTER